MRLKKQLLILSLFSLSLPWVGCQFVQEMESTLLQGQDDTLIATAKAIATTIAYNDTLRDELIKRNSTEQAVYLHPLSSSPLMDGYGEEWQTLALKPQTIFLQASPYQNGTNDKDKKIEILGGIYQQKTYLFLSFSDTSFDYFNPSKTIHENDHIILTTVNTYQKKKKYIVLASSPGAANIYERQNNTLEKKHHINAFWREQSQGYQLEIELPFTEIEHGLAFSMVNGNTLYISSQAKTPEQKHKNSTSIPITRSETLTHQLQLFEESGLAIKLASHHAAYIAGVGDINIATDSDTPWLVQLIYRMALSPTHKAIRPSPDKRGFFNRDEVRTALKGEHGVNHYAYKRHSVSSVAVPITYNNNVLGSVIVEQSSQRLNSFTNNAFNTLILYSTLAAGSVIFILIIYASWLSWRIRNLSHMAARAISETGTIDSSFRPSQLPDEIGDLSRSYAQLLLRIKEYTQYLKTLSNKLSHELRTPLAIITGSLDNLQSGNLPKDADTYAKRAHEGAQRLSRILDAMNAATRIEQSISSAEKENIFLKAFFTSLYEAYQNAYPKIQFELQIDQHKEDEPFYCAPDLLVQMLDKLVDNAADFCSDNGSVRLTLQENNKQYRLSVFNHGPPLPEKMQGQLFNSMVSIRNNTTDHHLGLGLYIARLISEHHQGSIHAYNVPERQGVVFEISLPKSNING